MKKSILLLLFMGFFVMEIFAQDRTTTLVSHPKVELGLQGLNVGYELVTGKNTLLDFNAGLGGGYSVQDYETSYTWNFLSPAFFAITEFRYYYNLNKRLSKHKKMGVNAGNYVGAQMKYATGGIFNNNYGYRLHNTFLTEIHWGIQRDLGKNFLFNLHVGLGYARDIYWNSGAVYLAAGVKFGYMF